MAENTDVGTLREKVIERTCHLTCVYIDSILLVLITVSNVTVGHFLDRLNATGFDNFVLLCLRVVLGLYTVVPMCVWFYKDVGVLIKNANRDIAAAGVPRIPDSMRATHTTVTVDAEADK